jgi:hypothetical protein
MKYGKNYSSGLRSELKVSFATTPEICRLYLISPSKSESHKKIGKKNTQNFMKRVCPSDKHLKKASNIRVDV